MDGGGYLGLGLLNADSVVKLRQAGGTRDLRQGRSDNNKYTGS